MKARITFALAMEGLQLTTKIARVILLFAAVFMVAGCANLRLDDGRDGFVSLAEAVPDAILEIRYYSTYNFVGERIYGYEEPCAMLTKEAALALKSASDDAVRRGYRLKIYDAYRPQRAVAHFMRWAKDAGDTRMKYCFYPNLDKSVLFERGYIAEKSGHSRGSTVDLTLFDMKTGREVDMGGTFDWFGEESHPSYKGVSEKQYANRMLLREIMTSNGFKPLEEEWWHFTLANEPYPDTYFDFPVREEGKGKRKKRRGKWEKGRGKSEEMIWFAITEIWKYGNRRWNCASAYMPWFASSYRKKRDRLAISCGARSCQYRLT